MTVSTPVDAARDAARDRPEAPGLDAAIRHAGGWDAISITASPQSVDVTLTNRMARACAIDAGIVDLGFRPGILTDTDAIALAPQSEPGWHLTLATLGDGSLRLRLHAAKAGILQPGDSLTIRLVGVSADPVGGSRSSRVGIEYAGFLSETGTEVSGRALVHLPVLRRHPPRAAPRPRERAGTAMAYPFFAGVLEGAQVLNDGKSGNRILVRIMNISGQPVRLNHLGDEATRFHLHWRRGLRDANFGLLGAEGGHLALRPYGDVLDDDQVRPDRDMRAAPRDLEDWVADRHTLRRLAPGDLSPGAWIDLSIELFTDAEDGAAELTVSFENLPDHDDGDLSVPITLGSLARVGDSVHVTRPLELRGADASLSFHVGEEGTAVVPPDRLPRLSVGRTEADLGALVVQAPLGMRVAGSVTALSFATGGMVTTAQLAATTATVSVMNAGQLTVAAVTATGSLTTGVLEVSGNVTATTAEIDKMNTKDLEAMTVDALRSVKTKDLTVTGTPKFTEGSLGLANGWEIVAFDDGLWIKHNDFVALALGSDGSLSTLKGTLLR